MSDDQVPEGLRYTKEHEWIRMEGEIAVVGITHYAQEALGDLVYVELPQVGSEVERDSDFAVVESVKAASEVYAPISGEVLEVNEALSDEPELINSEPYADGWIAKIKPSDKDELDECMDADKYASFLESLD